MENTIEIPPQKKKACRICLGTWAIGGWMWGITKEEQSIKTILKAFDLGINMVDTAPVYGFGKSEEIVGKALKQYGRREDIILATKVGLEFKGGKVWRNSSRQRILQEIDDSLRRLQTDYIDIYIVHWPDPAVPMSETAQTLLSLLESGKIKTIGVSHFSKLQMEEFSKYAPIHAAEPPYNLFERQIENEILPFNEKSGIVTLAYDSLCRGLLTGKITTESKFKVGDLRKVDPKFQQPCIQQYLAAVSALDDFAKKNYQKDVLALAVRWVLDNQHTIALWDARFASQLEKISDVIGWSLDAGALSEIDKILAQHIKAPVGSEFLAPPA